MENFFKTNKLFLWCAKYRISILFFVFFILTAWISFSQSIWLDEGLGIEFSKKTIPEILDITMKTDLHPPLYYFWLHFSHLFFTPSIFIDRIWSGFFYIISGIILSRYIAKKEGTGQPLSFLGGLFFLISPFAIFYASEARSYSALILISLVQFIFFEQMLKESSKKSLIFYSISSVIGSYLFYPFIFSLVAQFFYVCTQKREKFKIFFIAWGAIFLAYLPWIYFVLIHRLDTDPGHFLQIPWWQIPIIIFIGFSGGRVAITDLNHLHWYWPTIIISIAYSIQFVGLFFLLKDISSRNFLKLIGYLLFIPLGISLLISAARFSIFDPRYYAGIFFIFSILLVLSSLKLKQVSKKIWLVFTTIFIFANLLFLGLYMYNPWFAREPWNKVVPKLEERLQFDDVVVFIGCQQPPPTYSAYQKKEVRIISTSGSCDSGINDFPDMEKHLKQEVAVAKRVWFSHYLEWQKDPGGVLRGVIERDFKAIETIGFFKVQFTLYERK